MMRLEVRRAVVLGLLAPAAVAGAPSAIAAPGDLDPGFGRHGVVPGAALGSTSPLGIVAGPGGSLYVMGDRSVTKLSGDGSVDREFGAGGHAEVHAVGPIFDLAVQPDGRLLVAGRAGADGGYAVARLLPDGRPDPGFGDAGVATVPPEIDVTVLAAQADGKVVVAGPGPSASSPNPHARLIGAARLRADGSLDSGFAGDGTATIDAGPDLCSVTGLGIQSDGSIVIAGGGIAIQGPSYANPCPGDVRLVRLRGDGTPDGAFGSGGVAGFDFGYAAVGELDVLSDDRILVLEQATVDGSPAARMLRVGDRGQLDETFGEDGQVVGLRPSPRDGFPAELLTARDGSIVTVSHRPGGFFRSMDVLLAGFDASGRPDGSFGSRGIVDTDFGLSYDLANAAAIDSAGRIVVLTWSPVSVARYLTAPGRRDRDADGTRDRRDRCPEVYARRDGCHHFDRTIEGGVGAGVASGSVLSETDGCKWNVVVQIVRAGSGRHRVLARTRTDSRGIWQFDRSFSGPVRARAPGRFADGVGYCPGAHTPRLQG